MIHLLVNPLARDAQSLELTRQARSHFGESSCCFCPFPFDQHISDRYNRGQRGSNDRILVIGGDGTLNRAINALQPSAPPIALIPAGTANDLAASIGIPKKIDEAFRIARCGWVHEIDLLSVNGRLFATCGGIGLPARSAYRANEWRSRHSWVRGIARRLGSAVYVAAATLELLRSRKIDVEIQCGSRTITEDVLALLVANQPRVGKRYVVAPAASNCDGRLDLCVIPRPTDWNDRLALFREAAFGRIDALPFVRRQRAIEITIRTEKAVPFFGDGEILCFGDTFHVRTLPSALRVVSPHSEGIVRHAA